MKLEVAVCLAAAVCASWAVVIRVGALRVDVDVEVEVEVEVIYCDVNTTENFSLNLHWNLKLQFAL